MTMSETELSVVCKNCGSEVSPYVTECPYCGARLRKRAPKLERRGDGLEPKPRRRGRPHFLRRPDASPTRPFRPYATMVAILGPAALLLMQKATGYALGSFGGLVVPFEDQWWRFLTAPVAYVNVGYLFVVAVGLASFPPGLARRLGTVPPALFLVAGGSLGMLVAGAIANARAEFVVIAGGTGMALGAVAAWFTMRRAEVHGAIDDDYDA